jgi:alpha-amylase/alpha-mannosidase (GH57 family)
MRFVCVHGHFYQPPRENPSLEAIELQDSAYPYHDWNERVCAECYAPNASSRILNDQSQITEIVNNYAEISFNFGPTLLSWIEEKAPRTYQLILQADQESQQRFSGHGSAIAQGYNHMILPLANARDKSTQVKWGIADFEKRFGRKPEGMWLPETAVNTDTLEALAANGIRFTILAPRQAKRVRRKGGRKWIDVTGDRIDPSRAYLVQLPSRKTINVFFYDGPISQGVAFEGLLDNGRVFAERLLSGFSDVRTWPQIMHIATDGESYGHHHHFGEMALSYALNHIQADHLAELINYGQFLERFPADHIVEIVEDTSWSCVHGIERWRSNCGCNSGGHGDWNQEWRAPLRASLDWLRDSLAPLFEQHAAPLLKDPWAARDSYISVILDRSDESVDSFFRDHATHDLNCEERVRALKLLEMQRHALLMYTSCGWFFDELSGLETVQVIHYAGRALRLVEDCCAASLEQEFLNRLREAKSNLPEHGDGAQIYEKWVKPAYIDMLKVAAHYAISSLFENYEPHARIYCYQVERRDFAIDAEGKLRLATGSAKFSSDITRETGDFSFAVVHLGDHNLIAGVRQVNAAADEALRNNLKKLFAGAEATEVIRVMNEEFKGQIFSLKSLFRDEQRKITSQILEDTVRNAAASYRSIYDASASLIRFLRSLSIPVPAQLSAAAEVALNNQLRDLLQRPDPDVASIEGLVREAASAQIPLDNTTLEFTIRQNLERAANEFAQDPQDVSKAHRLRNLLELSQKLPFPVTLWQVQNVCYPPLSQKLQASAAAAGNGGSTGKNLQDEYSVLRERLKILNA